MIKMKRGLFKLFALMIGSALIFTSCLDDGNSTTDFWVDYGEIVMAPIDPAAASEQNMDIIAQESYKIRLDNGTMLNIIYNMVPNHPVVNGQRIIADYTILAENPTAQSTTQPRSYDVKLNYLYDVLSKPPVLASKVNTEEQQDSLGRNKINIVDAWMGQKYLNINFQIFRRDPNIAHMISLVVDDEQSSATDLYVKLRHHAKGDTESIAALGRVSFNMSQIVNEIESGASVNVHLSWDSYDSGTKEHTIIFKKQ